MTIAKYLPRFRQAARRLAEVEAREHWSPPQMREWQLERLNELWKHAAANVTYYHYLAGEHSLPPRFDSIEHFTSTMPLLSKESIRQRPDDFVFLAGRSGRWRKTSGSTGIPMQFFESAATHQQILTYQYRFRQLWGLDIFDRAAFLGAGTAQSAGTIDRWRESLVDRLRNRVRIPVHQLGRDQLARQLDRMAKFRPAYLYGYSRAIYLLALEAIARGLGCDSLRVVMMTSEPAFPHMIATVERSFGVPAVIEYGATECGVTAYEWRDRKLRARADRVLIETLPRDDGRFDIVKTVLDNHDFPLLRYRIEDVTDAPIETGNAFPVLQNIAGRNDDVLYAADDSPVHPAEIDGIFESAAHSAVRRYRLHQSAAGEIAVQIEPVDRSCDVQTIQAAVARIVPGRDVRIELVDHIEQTIAGKHRLITSDYK